MQDGHPKSFLAICTDSCRAGCAIFCNSNLKLMADRRDPGDPYRGLDLLIQRFAPSVVIVSFVQKKLITFLEKRFTFKLIDMSKKNAQRVDLNIASNPHENSQIDSNQTHAHAMSPVVFNLQSQHVASSATSTLPNDNISANMDMQGLQDQFGEGAFTLVIVPNMWFCMSKGYKILLDCELTSSLRLKTPEEKNFFISSKVKKSTDVCAIRSIAAIERYLDHLVIGQGNKEVLVQHSQQLPQSQCDLQNYRTRTDTQVTGVTVMPIIDIRYIDPGPVLSIDRLTLESLGIFTSAKKKIYEQTTVPVTDSNQQCPSLFELLNQCRSPQGKLQLQTMMMWPLQDANELRFRYDVIEFFFTPEGNILRDKLLLHLKNISPLEGVLSRLSQSVASHSDMVTIYKSIWSFVTMIDLIKSSLIQGLDIIDRIQNLECEGLRDAATFIVNVIDFAASKKERRVQLCPGIDQNVDEKKELIDNLPKFCDEVAAEETAKYKDIMGRVFRVLYVPRIGFLSSVDYLSSGDLEKIKTNSEFEVLLHTEQSVYFKTKRMDELDSRVGDVACDLIDVQEDVLIKLQDDLLKQTEIILKLMEVFGELDCLIAFATVSQQRGYSRPELSVTDEINISQAYHPLQSIRNNIVPNDIDFFNVISQRKSKVMIITGPNSCGKTTYMKALGLIVYMALIGCFVPALKARLPIVDAILTRLNSSNSVSTGLSSFASDLFQVNYALTKATEKSLIIIDEFGRGTLPRHGFALLVGLVTYFASRAQTSPYIIVSTHFNHLIDHVQNFSEYIIYRTFKVSRDTINNSVVYEYKLVDGVGESSLADKVAEKAGVPQYIIDRASAIRASIAEGRNLRPRPPRGA